VIVLRSIAELWTERAEHLAMLSVAEMARFATLRWTKQKQQHLAGRVAAKIAVAGIAGLAASRVSIVRNADGVPLVCVDEMERPDLFVSISHSGDLVAAVAGFEPVGIDVERVEEREAGFVELVFTEAERAELEDARAVTFAWCTKEARGKQLGVGLSRPFAELDLSKGTGIRRETIFHRGVEHAMVLAKTA
jgi:phosphopantetheinyl transferase